METKRLDKSSNTLCSQHGFIWLQILCYFSSRSANTQHALGSIGTSDASWRWSIISTDCCDVCCWITHTELVPVSLRWFVFSWGQKKPHSSLKCKCSVFALLLTFWIIWPWTDDSMRQSDESRFQRKSTCHQMLIRLSESVFSPSNVGLL